MKTKRIISFVLAFAMVVSFAPGVFAADESDYAQKGGRTYYTDEMIENAKANIKANKSIGSANTWFNRAKTYHENFDWYYNAIMGEGMPRSVYTSLNNALGTVCLSCGASTSYTLDIEHWKVTCSKCNVSFPSNDFKSFYKLGLQSDGTWSYDAALEAHHNTYGEDLSVFEELFGGVGEKGSDNWNKYYGVGNSEGFLYNASGNSLGTTWGVDDGFGYVTDDGTYVYAAYFAFMFWTELDNVLEAFKYAYMYYDESNTAGITAEGLDYTVAQECGRMGALIVDRIADFFPAYDTSTWEAQGFITSSGGSGKGKIQGRINDCDYTTYWILAADAFYPVLADETFQAQFVEKTGKTDVTPETIWKNWADGILRETYTACQAGQLDGNAVMEHETLATAALVLGIESESKTWVEWLFKDATKDADGNSNYDGGDLNNILLNDVDRDGMGNEGSAGYNLGWVESFNGCADALKKYKEIVDPDSGYDLYSNPKLIKMFTAGIPVALTDTHTAQIGDTGHTASKGFEDTMDTLKAGFENITNTGVKKQLAEYIYRRNGYTTSGLSYGIHHENASQLASDVAALIDDDVSATSEMMTGYGFAVLRDGTATADTENKRDFWLSFGRSDQSHSNFDALNLGIEAFGLNMAPDIGSPAAKTENQDRGQWVKQTISHNTVTVNETTQGDRSVTATPLHFDDSGEVKLMDVDASDAYEGTTSIYRRTVVMIDAGDGVSYGVDFFRVNGGNDHIYSFHSQSHEVTTDLSLTAQEGTYAGANVAYKASMGDEYDTGYQYGFSYLTNVRRDSSVSDKFAVDFAVTDYRGVLSDSTGLHLRMTMLNDVDEVAIASGYVPVCSGNTAITNTTETLEYVLARRTGTDLDSLFTTVYEPYRNTRYLSDMSEVEVSPASTADDTVKAVKVVRADGRVDYIVYATNNSVLYTVTDGDVSFKFRGFVGVYSVDENGSNIYSYVNDGDVIGKYDGFTDEYTGTVSSFTEDLSLNNSITITTEDDVDVASLSGKYVYVENDDVQNGVYKIESATKNGDTVELDIGAVSLIRSLDDSSSYVYNIANGQSVTIPLSTAVEVPEFEAASEAFGTRNGFIRNMLEDDGTYSMYLFSGINSLNYAKAGFRVTLDGATKDFTTTDVYSKVTADNGEKLPSDFGGSSAYIFAIKLLGFTGFEKNKPIFFQPFAIDFEENRLFGEATEVKQIYETGASE